MIKTAMVLAAGHGTRMRPLTNDRAKAMVEVGGKPLIDHMLDRLDAAGIERAVVNVHAHADHLEAHLKKRSAGPDIIISDERDVLLETGGGMVKALPLLGDDPVLACNIDAVWTESGVSVIESLISRWDADVMDDLLLLAPLEQTLGYHGKGDFLFGHDGRRLAKEPIEPFSRNRIWNQTLELGTIFGYPMDGFWMHVGDPKARDEAEAILQK